MCNHKSVSYVNINKKVLSFLYLQGGEVCRQLEAVLQHRKQPRVHGPGGAVPCVGGAALAGPQSAHRGLPEVCPGGGFAAESHAGCQGSLVFSYLDSVISYLFNTSLEL